MREGTLYILYFCSLGDNIFPLDTKFVFGLRYIIYIHIYMYNIYHIDKHASLYTLIQTKATMVIYNSVNILKQTHRLGGRHKNYYERKLV